MDPHGFCGKSTLVISFKKNRSLSLVRPNSKTFKDHFTKYLLETVVTCKMHSPTLAEKMHFKSASYNWLEQPHSVGEILVGIKFQ